MTTTQRRAVHRRAKRENERATDGAVATVDFHAAPRAAQAMRLRRLGYTYDEIAERCGYANESSARSVVKRASARIVRDEAQALVGWQLDMIDQALQVVMERIAKNNKDSLWAVDRLTPLLKRQAELMGLDKKDDAYTGAQVIIRAYPSTWVDALPPPPSDEEAQPEHAV